MDLTVTEDKNSIPTALDRRQFLRSAGVAGASLLAVGMVAGCGGSTSPGANPSTSSLSDVDILNFALNLEYLEAEFYAYATTGSGLNPSLFTGTGTQGATTGGVRVTMDAATMAIATEIANDEMEHVAFLRSALGSYAVAKPAINLAALGSVNTQALFLAIARAFEDVGVSAYAGAAPLITSKTYLQAAAQILAVEAYHAGNIRLQVAQQSVSTAAVDSQDILPPPSGTKYFTNDSTNALSLIRTPRQVLDIVYGTVNVARGGFFPAAMNGTINR